MHERQPRCRPGERRDPYSVTLKLKDGADATAQQRHPAVMDPGVRRDDWLRGSCLDLDTRFGPAARYARAFARNLCPKRAWGKVSCKSSGATRRGTKTRVE